jgi:hypothetical protein
MASDLEFGELKDRVKVLEDRMAEKDTQYAVINTKLSAILWGVGVIGTAVIGVLIKMLFGA